jgi:protoporphyrinogen IX oxidase
MIGWLGAAYPWVKAAHLIFVIFWLAGLFMVPRHFIYHSATAPGSPEDAQWIKREAMLAQVILNPSMILAWLLGLMLAFDVGAWRLEWFHAKLLLVVGLTGYHGWVSSYRGQLARGRRPLSDKTLRIMNEVPGIATALIVILVIVRPF